MKNKLITFLLSLTLVVNIPLAFVNANDKSKDYIKENNNLSKDNDSDNKKIDSLNKEIHNKKNEITNAEDSIKEVSLKLKEISQKIADSETTLKKLHIEFYKIKKDLRKSIKVERKIKREMKLRIQFMYENSNNNFLVLLLQNSNFLDLLNGAEYRSSITQYDRKKLNEYIQIKNQIKSKKDHQQEIIKKQRDINDQLILDKKKSEELIDEQNKLIADNKTQIENMSDEVKKIHETINSRNKKIAENILEAQKALAALNGGNANFAPSVAPPSDGKVAASGYIWPVPSKFHTITSPFSLGRRLVAADYVNGGHLGIDIGAPIGTPIYSVRNGVVVWAAFDSVSGNMVCIVQDDGRVVRYAHMSSMAVSKGQAVTQRQVIGYVGMTGSATGPHLHFQVEQNANAPFGSTAFNPLVLY